MKNHSSRGVAPDAKRGRSGVMRVLQEMGAPILDSDLAASVDALLTRIRLSSRGSGCAAGSPDLGFLVTPGRLLGVFAELTERLQSSGADVWLDYRHRYLDRFPALYVAPTGDADGTVTMPLPVAATASVSPRAALWSRVESGITIGVNGAPVALSPQPGGAPQRVELPVPAAGFDSLQISVPAGEAVWLFLLEQDEAAGEHPRFWVSPGTFHLDGLVVEAPAGAPFPAAGFPTSAGFPWDDADARPPLPGLVAQGVDGGVWFVAYLEAWERHITHVEDPGIREEALGAAGDTSTRTQLLGQVKVATVEWQNSVRPTVDELRDAFGRVRPSGGTLTIGVPATTPTSNPCALPDPGGYRGADNRLYLVETHIGGGLGDALFKYSRNNGADLFAARLGTSGQLVFDAGTDLAGGDIVEVLSHVVDLGDQSAARVGVGGFTPAERATGQLAELVTVDTAGRTDEVVFTLVNPVDGVAVTLDDRYGVLDDAVLKVRRWDGLLDPQGSPGPHVLEDAITVTLSAGEYRPGQYWQYEARVGRDNANGPWREQPHGPERLFAPLAVFSYEGADEPVSLVAWLDERFSRLCEIEADGVAFAGARVGSPSDTVQEAIEELFERPPEIVDSSCGELIVRTENDLQTVFDTIPAGESGRVCIQPGTWDLTRTVEVAGKGDLIISCAGAATRLRATGIDTALRFTGCGRVHIQDLVVEGGQRAESGDGLAGALSFVNCAGVDLRRVTVSCGDGGSRRMSAVEVRNEVQEGLRPEVRVRDCQLRAGNAQVGLLVVNASSADVEGNLIETPTTDWQLDDALDDPEVGGRIARLAVDAVQVGVFDDEDLVGGDFVQFETLPDGRRRADAIVADWAARFQFTTSLGFSEAQWLALFTGSPIHGHGGAAPPARVQRQLRRLRRDLVGVMFGREVDLDGLSEGVREQLVALADVLRARNGFAAGDQGVVLAGTGAPIDPEFPQPVALAREPQPDVRIANNRIIGFTQGIHVGTSGRSKERERGLSYRVSILDNTVHLRVPSLARDRHGIFVGSAFQTRVLGNTVELRRPQPGSWDDAPAMDAIRAYGTFGPLLQIVDNTCIGTTRGVFAHAINRGVAPTAGWRWTVSGNAHARSGPAAPEQVNW